MKYVNVAFWENRCDKHRACSVRWLFWYSELKHHTIVFIWRISYMYNPMTFDIMQSQRTCSLWRGWQMDLNLFLWWKGKKKDQRSQPPKCTFTPPERCVYAIWKQFSKRFLRYCPETELIIRHQLTSIMASTSKVKIRSKFIPPKRHIYTPWGMCVCNMKQSSKCFARYHPETYYPKSIRVNNHLKIKGKK